MPHRTLVSSHPGFDEQWRFIGTLILVTDVTERRKQEAEIAALNRNLQVSLLEVANLLA